jgi:hypothetical protein
LRNELSLGRPIIYAGFGKGSGHCFVLEGYSSYALTNNAISYKFSINWGWSGYCDGNYTLDNLIPSNGSLGIKPYPIFEIPMSNQSSASNFATFTSDMVPVVKFNPNFNNIRIRLFDMDGNILQFDTSNTKPSDLTFKNGIIPSYLGNVYLRMAFTRRQ